MGSHAYLSQNQTVFLGPVRIDVLWPPAATGSNPFDSNDENNNSLVLALSLGNVCFLLTGDCQAENWDLNRTDHVAVPQNTRVAQQPHHGAKNGLFDVTQPTQPTPMLDQILTLQQKKTVKVLIGLSCHIRPHKHPHTSVISKLDANGVATYRTDKGYHTTFRTDGTKVEVRYAHY
jgi:beta-lactamase superfamily II metal-dependent hydrolase